MLFAGKSGGGLRNEDCCLNFEEVGEDMDPPGNLLRSPEFYAQLRE